MANRPDFQSFDLEGLERNARTAMAVRVPMGHNDGDPHTRALSAATTAWLRENSEFPREQRGRYSVADRYADVPSFPLSPNRTSVRYASGKAGRRSVGRQFN